MSITFGDVSVATDDDFVATAERRQPRFEGR